MVAILLEVSISRIKRVLFCLLLTGVAIPTYAEENRIGSVKTYRPGAIVLHDGVEHSINVGTGIYSGDTIITQEDGSVGVTFIDGAVLTLGPDTRLVIDDFVFKPESHNLSFLSTIFEGTAAFISGAIGRMSPEHVKIKTPTATLGLRGTKILVAVE